MKDIEIKIPPFCDGIKSIFHKTTETIINKFKESMKNYTLNVIVMFSLVFLLIITCIFSHFAASIISILLFSIYVIAACSEFDNNHTETKNSTGYLKKYDYNDYCNNKTAKLVKYAFNNIRFNKNITLYEAYKLILSKGIILEIEYRKYNNSWYYRYWDYKHEESYLAEKIGDFNTYSDAFSDAIYRILKEITE